MSATDNAPELTLEQFYDSLCATDWHSDMSDDHRVYLAGQRAKKHREQIAGQSDAHRVLFDEFQRYIFSGPAWKTDKLPKPPRPVTPRTFKLVTFRREQVTYTIEVDREIDAEQAFAIAVHGETGGCTVIGDVEHIFESQGEDIHEFGEVEA